MAGSVAEKPALLENVSVTAWLASTPVVPICKRVRGVGDASETVVIVIPDAAEMVTVTVANPDLVASCTEVAVTVAEPAVAGAVNSPAESTVPPFADHVTAELKLPVPVTVAAHCEVSPATTEVGLHATETDVMADFGVTVSVIVMVADFVVSVLLVAVRVTLVAAVTTDGAVYVTPVVLELLSAPTPEPMPQVTPALTESFLTVAVNAWAPPSLRDTVDGLMLTLMAAGAGFWLEPPPP
jgi:hypothetical protein